MARPPRLSGKDKDTFAYFTIRDRMPVILTKAIDTVHKHAGRMLRDGKKDVSTDCSLIVERLSKLKNEMLTNKQLSHLEDGGDDEYDWNALCDHIKTATETEPTWFETSWLFAECYMYRRIHEAIVLSSVCKDFDPFEEQKQQAYFGSQTSILQLAECFGSFTDRAKRSASEKAFSTLSADFERALKLSLWGNKTDLSILAKYDGSEDLSKLQTSSIDSLKQLDSKLLVDDTHDTFDLLLNSIQSDPQRERGRIDIVLDNSGYELFNDLCLADWLLCAGFATIVHLHIKCFPWFVSDATRRDFDWLLDQLHSSDNPHLRRLGENWHAYVSSGSWNVREHKFWTLPHEFVHMKTLACDLYEGLAKSNLVIMKGDLNYRKLLADRHWPHDVSFVKGLDGFSPAPILALRSLKAELVVGLKPGQDRDVAKQDGDWMISGQYAVVQLQKSNENI